MSCHLIWLIKVFWLRFSHQKVWYLISETIISLDQRERHLICNSVIALWEIWVQLHLEWFGLYLSYILLSMTVFLYLFSLLFQKISRILVECTFSICELLAHRWYWINPSHPLHISKRKSIAFLSNGLQIRLNLIANLLRHNRYKHLESSLNFHFL
jgi:hypothetical protein